MNIIDIIILVTLIAFTLIGIRKGLIISVFKFFSFVISLYLSFKLYPFISKTLKSMGTFYYAISDVVNRNINLQESITNSSKSVEAEIINSLTLPQFLKDVVLQNNNTEIYKLVGANTINDYITNFLTNIIVNLISLIVVFILVSLLINIIGSTLDILSRLPIIHTLNKTGGALFGLCQGLVFVFIIILIIYTFSLYKIESDYYKLLNSSFFVKQIYLDNFIIDLVLKY